jgi:hypothetical protein
VHGAVVVVCNNNHVGDDHIDPVRGQWAVGSWLQLPAQITHLKKKDDLACGIPTGAPLLTITMSVLAAVAGKIVQEV